MIIETILNDDLIQRVSDDPSKILHKIGTGECYTSAIDLINSTYEYEEVDNPDYEHEIHENDETHEN